MTETVIGFDFGGTWLRAAEVGRDGSILWDERRSPARDYPKDLEIVRGLVERRSDDVVAAAVASPGPLDFHTGEVMRAANLQWLNQFPGRDIGEMLGVPTVVENDADVAALAEATYGAGRDADVLVYYGIGTGVGSGVVVNRAIFHGSLDPEFGHQILEPGSDRRCTAGHRGCLEALISGGSLVRVFGSVEAVPAEEWCEIVPHYLGQALANAALFLSPRVIVLGGGVIDHRLDIVPPAIREMEIMLEGFVPRPRVMISELGKEVGILGAAAAAWKIYAEDAASR